MNSLTRDRISGVQEWKAHDFYVGFFFFFSFVFHQKPMALRPSYSTTENLPEENRLLYPKGSWQKKKKTPWSLNIVALQVPPISSLPISLVSLLELNPTDRKERTWFIWAEEQSHQRWHLYRINHSYQRERDSALWTETWYYFIQK